MGPKTTGLQLPQLSNSWNPGQVYRGDGEGGFLCGVDLPAGSSTARHLIRDIQIALLDLYRGLCSVTSLARGDYKTLKIE